METKISSLQTMGRIKIQLNPANQKDQELIKGIAKKRNLQKGEPLLVKASILVEENSLSLVV